MARQRLCQGGARRPLAHCPHAHTRALRPRQQAPPSPVQTRHAADDEEPIGILCQPAVPHFGPPEDPLDHQEHLFDFGVDVRLGAVAGALRLAQGPMAMGVRLDEVLGIGSVLTNHVALPAVGRVAPHAGLLPMQQVGQHLAVRHIRRRGRDRMDQCGPTVHSYCWIAASRHCPSWIRMKVQASPDSVGISSLPSTRYPGSPCFFVRDRL